MTRKSDRPSAPSKRADKAALRRTAITDAALAEFSEKGFAATRMEDVAARAGVAKGTIYLHFADKRALFEALVRELLSPVLESALADPPREGERLPIYLERTFVPALLGMIGTRRGDLVRLLLTEGRRFPDLAEIHHREVITPAMAFLRRLAETALRRGELQNEALLRFPQLLVAPALIGLLWSALFERVEHLDVEAMVRAQLSLLFREPDRPAPGATPGQTGSDPRISIPKPDSPT